VTALFQWAFFFLPPFGSAYAALYVWGKSSSMGYALVSGTLAGVVLLFLISGLFWSGTDVCEQCHMESN
jgi:hypothetical protein